MGVSGLTPFLQKTCPEVIRTLPDRLRQLTGKTVVIDGTLITQRFHFAAVPHPYRHILGWYRLVKELEDHGVKALCVFDGKERSLAKQNETERRRTVRKLTAARASIETERLQRLQKLNGLLAQAGTVATPPPTFAPPVANVEYDVLVRPRPYWPLPYLGCMPTSSTLVEVEDESRSQPVQGVQTIEEESTAQPPIGNALQPGAQEHMHDSVTSEIAASPDYLGGKEDVLDMPLQEATVSSLAEQTVQEDILSVEQSVDLPIIEPGLNIEEDRPIQHATTSVPETAAVVAERLLVEPAAQEPNLSVDQTTSLPEKEPDPLSEAPKTGEAAVETESLSSTPLVQDGTHFGQAVISSTIEPDPLAEEKHHPTSTVAMAAARVESLLNQVPVTIVEELPPSREGLSPETKQDAPLGTVTESVQAQMGAIEPAAAALQQDLSIQATHSSDLDDFANSDAQNGDTVTLTVPFNDGTTTLSSLFADFERSISQVNIIASSPTTSDRDITGPDMDEARQDTTMSRTQAALTVAESKIWEEINASGAPAIEAIQASVREGLAELESKSVAMSASLDRRINAPTEQTYKECKEILCALGTPCVESTGAFEAEALASSLVAHGYADYVASEDTDVLVYDAPLLRNISSRTGPLTIMSGPDIRSVLQLDRASFVDFALLLGTDFTQRIKNVGPARAYKFIRQHGSIESVLAHEKAYPPRMPASTYLRQVETARVVFETLPPVPKRSLLNQTKRDEGRVAKVLARYGVQKEEYEWEGTSALGSDYFGDKPSVNESDFSFKPYF